jgi:hypothetical protein
MSHLHDTHQNYVTHLFRAWKISFILLVHGVLPNVWKNKASDLLCKERLGDDATRKYLLKTMWGIEERKGTPGVWDRLSDREVAAKIELGYIERAEKEKALQQPKKKNDKK